MAELSIQGAHEEVVVDLGVPTKYILKGGTRSTLRALLKVEEEVSKEADGNKDLAEDVDDTDAAALDRLIEFQVSSSCKVLDAILAPEEGNIKASSVVKKRWKADELRFEDLASLTKDLAARVSGSGKAPTT